MKNLKEMQNAKEFEEELKELEKDKEFIKEYDNYRNSRGSVKKKLTLEEYYYLKKNNYLQNYDDFLVVCLRENKKEFIENAFTIYFRYKTQDKIIPYYRKNFVTDIFNTEKSLKHRYSCNLSKIDEIFKGFRSGLYVLGAETGAGKTSLMLQMADAFAQNKNYVIYCSLEMSQKELVSKSLTRISKEQNKTIDFTSFEVLNNELDNKSKDIINKSKEFYSNNIEQYLYFTDLSTALELKELVEEYIEYYKLRPIIFVDYIQIMKYDKKSADTIREEVDNVIKELKSISKQYDLTIFALSSLNRANYSVNLNSYNKKTDTEQTEFSTAGFKESGLIDYTADVLLKLVNSKKSYTDIENDLIQPVDLLVLKNRNSYKNLKVSLDFLAEYSYFK